jgi:hypothetical protein
MPVYAIIATKRPEDLGRKIETDYPDDFISVRDDVWLVDYDGTTQGLAAKLGIRSGESGSGLVIPVDTYSGRANADIWDWLKVHMSRIR